MAYNGDKLKDGPKTWADFMANNAKIKAAGKVPVIQTFGEIALPLFQPVKG